MFTALLCLSLFSGIHAQSSTPAQPKVSEMERLRNEFISATKDYAALLEKQKPGLQRNVARAEDQLTKLRSLYGERLISIKEVEAGEQALQAAKDKVTEIDQAIANANKRIEELPSLAEMEKEAKKAARRRPGRRGSSCANWTLTAYRRETKNEVRFAYRLICTR